MKKLLGLGLALVMALSVMVIPTTAFAADGDLLTLTLNGVKVNAPEGMAPGVTWKQASAMTTTVTNVILSAADATITNYPIATTFDGGVGEISKIVKISASSYTSIADGATITDLFTSGVVDPASATEFPMTGATFTDGDILIASSTSWQDYYVFKVFVGDASSNTIEGEGTVENVLLRVVLPVNLDFALNPLQLGQTGDNQISTTDYPIVNKTKAPVQVEFALTATTTNSASVTFATDSSLVKPDDTEATDKLIFLALLGASGTNATVTTTDPITSKTDFTASPFFIYDSAAEGTLLPMLSTPADAPNDKPTATITFALDAADENGDLAADDKGVASFQFFGIMNTYAPWQASTDKITVSGTYKLTPLRGATYKAYVGVPASPTEFPSQFAKGGLNQLKSEIVNPSVKTGFISGSDIVSTLATANGKVGSFLTSIPFSFGGKNIDSVTINGTDFGAAHYRKNTAGNAVELTFGSNGTKNNIVIKLVGDSTSYTITSMIITN